MEWWCIIVKMLIMPYCNIFWCGNCIFYQNCIFWCNPWDVWI